MDFSRRCDLKHGSRTLRTRFGVEALEERRLLSANNASAVAGLQAEAAAAVAPTVAIGSSLVGTPGATIHVPVTIDNANALQAIDFVIRYDTTRLNLSVSDITRGGLLAGWTLTPVVNDSQGIIAISSFTTSPLAVGGGTLFDLAFHVDPAAVSGIAYITLPAAQNAFALNEGAIVLNAMQGSVVVNAAGPTVAKVVVGSTQWNSDFQNYLVSHNLGTADGYAIPFGVDQTRALPWSGLNRISIEFSEEVQITSSDLQVVGTAGVHAVSGFSYNSTSHTATWTLTTAIGADKLELRLSDAVHDSFNKALDGEWTTNQAHGPSGNGVPGGQFHFRINTLPGDANGNGTVDGSDYTLWADNLSSVGPLSLVFADFTGNGRVDGADYTVWADHFLAALPQGPLPAATASSVPDSEFAATQIAVANVNVDYRMRSSERRLVESGAHSLPSNAATHDVSDRERRASIVDRLASVDALWGISDLLDVLLNRGSRIAASRSNSASERS